MAELSRQISLSKDTSSALVYRKLYEEILDRTVSGSRFVVEDNFVRAEIFEQILQTLIADSSRECKATHDPTSHVHRTAIALSQITAIVPSGPNLSS
jgi:hypothetical protein